MSTHAECSGNECPECWGEGYDAGYNKARGEVERLREAVIKFGLHLPNCDSCSLEIAKRNAPCSCGYTEALALADTEDE